MDIRSMNMSKGQLEQIYKNNSIKDTCVRGTTVRVQAYWSSSKYMSHILEFTAGGHHRYS